MGKLLSIKIIEFIVNVYDIVTLPVYYLVQQPWKVQQEATRVRARQVEDYTWENIETKLDKSSRRSIDTLDELFRESVSTYASKKSLGVRKILAVEYKDSESCNGGALPNQSSATNSRVVSKYVMDDKYTWHTYRQIEEIVIKLSAGLTNLCGESLQNSDGTRKVLICADTCMQWFMVAHACFRNNVTVVTAYTSLDDEAILHTVRQTEVKIFVTSQKFARRLPAIVAEAPSLDTIIVLDDPLPGDMDELTQLKDLLGKSNMKHVVSYEDLIARGSTCKENIAEPPRGEDIAVLMYTSGSSGQPKGVLLSHKSIVYTALSFSGPGDISHDDRYIGYLPLGHVLELAAECIFLRNGSTIAYSSPMTLTNNSPMIRKGQYGDAYIFKPTIMGAVPLVLDRVRTGIQQAVRSRGRFFDQLINQFVVEYKRYWWERYYDTPIMNWLICRKFNLLLGGEMRAICSGGAALSKETQEYLRHVPNFRVLQGYGLTETSAAASFCDVHDRRYNVVGAPYPIVRVKLESWSDYSVDDKPYPRGEVIIGGQPVSSGYYKLEEQTKESFFVDEKTNMRYFRTGDIGMMLPDGVLKIIDRKKDLVKPLSGEYISLSEIETVLRACSIIENVCVYCSQYSNYIVAIVKPDLNELRQVARRLFNESGDEGVKFRQSLGSTLSNCKGPKVDETKLNIDNVDLEILCSNKVLESRVLKMLQEEGYKKKLKRTQIPSRIRMAHNQWSPETGLVTASFKLRRREVERHYDTHIKAMYLELGQRIDLNS